MKIQATDVSNLLAVLAAKAPLNAPAFTGNAVFASNVAITGELLASNFSGSSSGTNTGDQTTITGNAGTATKLAMPRTLGITGDLTWTSPNFDGSANVSAVGTLATVNANTGTFGSSAAVPVLSVNAKGLVTAVATAPLGTAAQKNIGTSGNTVPVLDGANTWTGNQTFGNLTVNGDMVITGTTTTINATNLNVSDAIIALANNNTAGTVPYVGLKAERGSAGDDAYLLWDEGLDAFTAQTAQADDLSGRAYVAFKAGSFLSAVATGTAPLTVASTTMVSNLNVELLGGQNSAFYRSASNLNAGTLSASRLPTRVGDVTSPAGSNYYTLATVNSNVGSFGSATAAPVLTVNAKGLITAASSATITPAWSSITSTPTNLSGYGITDAVNLSGNQTITGQKLVTNHLLGGVFSGGSGIGKAPVLGGFALDMHPESSNPTLSPFLHNDLAFLTLRGGSCTTNHPDAPSGSSLWFDASPSYGSLAPAKVPAEGLIITINLPAALSYTTHIGAHFGNGSWKPTSFKTEIFGVTANDWIVVDDTASWSSAVYQVKVAMDGAGFNAIRFTFNGFNGSGLRIAQLYAMNYASKGLRDIYLPRDGGSMVSNSLVTNLNADLLDGQQGSYYQNASNINAGTLPAAQLPTRVGDVMSPAGSNYYTLATVNSNVGTFGSASAVPVVRVNAKGLVTSVSTIALGTSSTYNVGSSGNTIPLLDGNNTWAGSQNFTNTVDVSGAELPAISTTRTGVASWFLGGSGTAGDNSFNIRLNSTNFFSLSTGGAATFANTVSASNLSGTNTGDQTITLTGDVTGSGTGSFATTLATVNSNTGTFGSAAAVPVLTINSKGLITAASTAALGTAAVKNIGTSGNTIPTLDGGNTWSGNQRFTAGMRIGTTANAASITAHGDDRNTAFSGSSFAPVSTTTSNNASLGISTYRWNNLYVGTVDASGSISASNFSGSSSGTNTGDQTDISGNAGSATRLINTRTISSSGDVSWSVSFDGTGNASGTATLATVNGSAGTYGGAGVIPIIAVNSKGLVTSVATVSTPIVASFPAGTATTIQASDIRNITNPLTGVGYSKGVRFRFSALNDNSTTPYADVIDLSTYQDASGGNINALYVSKGNEFRILHKQANSTDRSTWVTKQLAYTDSDITGGAARLTTARTISASGDLSWAVSFNGTGDASAVATLATVNSNVGSYGSTSLNVPTFSVDAKGRITSAAQYTLGSAAGKNIGNSGNTVPTLDGSNVWSAYQEFATIKTTWTRAGTGSVMSIIESDGGTAYLTGYNVSTGVFTPLAIRGSTISMTQLTGGLQVYSVYSSTMAPGGVRMTSQIPGISWDNSSNADTNARSFALINNYSAPGVLDLLYSSANNTNPSVVAMRFDGTSGNISINGALYTQSVNTTGNLSVSGGITAPTVSVSTYLQLSSLNAQIVGAYDAAYTRGIYAISDAYRLNSTPSNGKYGSFHGLAFSYNPDYQSAGTNPQSKAGLGHQLLIMTNGETTTAIGEGIWTRSKILITSNDQSITRLNINNTSSNSNRTWSLVAGVHNETQDGFSIYDSVGGTRFIIGNDGNAVFRNSLSVNGSIQTFNTFSATSGTFSGNILGVGDNIYLSVDGSSRAGITKKAGFGPKFTHSNNYSFIVARSNSATIDASSTFTDELIIDANGAVFSGPIRVTGSPAQYGAGISAGFYGDGSNLAMRALNIPGSSHYFQSYGGAQTWATIGSGGYISSYPITSTGAYVAVTDGVNQDTSGYAPLGVTRAASAQDLAYVAMTRVGNVVWGMGIDANNRMIFGQATGSAAREMNKYLIITSDGSSTFNGPIIGSSRLTLQKGQALQWADSSDEIRTEDNPSWFSGDNVMTFKAYSGRFVFRNSSASRNNATIDQNGQLITASNILINNSDPVVSVSGRATAFYSGNKAAGWYTIAVNAGDRASARFGLRDTSSGNHQSVIFYATHFFGNGNTIKVLSEARYGGSPFRYLRIKRGSTYDGAMLQVYIDGDSTNCDVEVELLGDNHQASGWVLKNWVADGTDPGGLSTYSAVTNVAIQFDLDTIANGAGVSETFRANKLLIGYSGGPVTSPNFIKLDNGFVSTVNDRNNLKIFLYDGGGGDTYGFGLNNESGVEYHASSSAAAGKHRFYVGGSLRGTFANSGLDMGNFPVYSANPDYGVRFKVGGVASENIASITTTNGNVHIDALAGSETYINYYRGGAVNIGNGTTGTVYRMDGSNITHSPSGGVYLRHNAGNTLTASNTFLPVQFTRDGFKPVGTSGDSGNTNTDGYTWGYQEGGPWNTPYPDLILGYHTGIKMGGHTGYGGVRFYDNHPALSTTMLFSVGNGDSNVRVTNSLYVGGLVGMSSAYLSDGPIYLRTNGDTNHLIQRGYETNFGQADGIAHRFYQYLSLRSSQTGKYAMLANGATGDLYFDEIGAGAWFQRMQAWSTPNQGKMIGSIHLGAASSTANTGGALTFGARDYSDPRAAQAGIYVTSDGTYGTKMYLSTSNDYAAGSKTAISIDPNGYVVITRSSLTVASDIGANGSITAGAGYLASPSVGYRSNGYNGGGRTRLVGLSSPDSFGLSFFQGTGGINSNDTFTFHFGNPTAGAARTHNFTSQGRYQINTADAQDALIQVYGVGDTGGWNGRIITSNATLDRSVFLATYTNGNAGVFAHNNALTDWRDLYVNTVNGVDGGTVRMPSATYINGQLAMRNTSDNRRGTTRLFRREDDSNFSVQNHYDGSRWWLRGYSNDDFHAECRVGYADSAGNLQGYGSDTGAVANSIVRRDGSGYVNAVYYNQSSGNDENPSISQVMVTNGDNYFRKAGIVYFKQVLSQQGGASTWLGENRFRSNYDTGPGNSAPLQVFSDNGSGAVMSFHRGGYYALNMGLDSDNVFRIGGWSASPNRLQMDMSGNLTMSGNVTAYSDIRLKTNIRTITHALDRVKAMRGVWFDHIETGKASSGVIAQEFAEQAPELVLEDASGTKSVNYGASVGYLIEAIKELAEQNAALMARVAELEKR